MLEEPASLVGDDVEHVNVDTLRRACRHLPEAGGKGVRPTLARRVSEGLGGTPRMARPVARSVELVHTFTLVHDDLMDGDLERRGVDTVHRAFDADTALLAGDTLFALGFRTLSRDPRTGWDTVGQLADLLAEACVDLAEGQMMDVAFESSWPTLAEWEEMVRRKTGALFRFACAGAAVCMGSSRDTVRRLSEWGEMVGVAFQAQDDVLEFSGADMEKTATDLRNGKKPLPVVLAHDEASGMDRDHVEDAVRLVRNGENVTSHVGTLKDQVRTLDGDRSAQRQAKDYLSQVKNAVHDLPLTQHGKSRLARLVDRVANRDK